MSLTRLGADCVLLDPDKTVPSAFVNQINDTREINDKYGRATVIQASMETEDEVRDVVGRAAQTFGGVDVYIDAFMIQKPTPISFEKMYDGLDGLINRHLRLPLMFTQNVLAYMKNRKKGRVIFLLNESPSLKVKEDILGQAVRSGLVQFAAALSKQMSEFNVTVNALSVALTEEYILSHDLESKSIKEAMEKMKLIDPSLKITEPDKISQTIVFLVSSMGASMNGQNLRLS